MKPYMILKSTETITIQSAFPSRATTLLRRDDEGDFEDAHLVQHLFHRMSLLDFHSYKLFLATHLLG